MARIAVQEGARGVVWRMRAPGENRGWRMYTVAVIDDTVVHGHHDFSIVDYHGAQETTVVRCGTGRQALLIAQMATRAREDDGYELDIDPKHLTFATAQEGDAERIVLKILTGGEYL